MALLFFILNCLLVYSFVRLLLKLFWPEHQAALDWRGPVLISTLVQGSFTLVATELLSAVYIINQQSVMYLWLAWSGLLFIALISVAIWQGLRPRWPRWNVKYYSASIVEIIQAIGIFLILGGTLTIAWFAAPNNADAVTYHLSRVMYWIEHGSVAHFATNNLRQLYQMPGSEFFVLHAFLLNGNDLLASLPQWLAFFGCIIATSFVVKLLGGSRASQWLASVLAATLPVAILQSTSPKNDLLVAYWVILAVSFLLLLRQRRWWGYLVSFCLAVALALVTKATAFIYLTPFMFWFCFTQYKAGRKWFIASILCLVVAVTALIGPAVWRNHQVLGVWLGPSAGELDQVSYTNETLTPALYLSNLIRNIALHLSGPAGLLQIKTDRAVSWIDRQLGLSNSDSRITYGGQIFFVPGGDKLRHEDMAPNFFHALLVVITVLLWCWLGRNKTDRHIWYYAGAVTAIFLLFSAYLRWQPWHTRLHLPIFMLGIPFMAVVLGRLRYWWIGALIALLFLWQAQTYVVHNNTRSLVGEISVVAVSRQNQNKKTFYPQDEISSFARLHRCADVGLMLGADENEYPFWSFIDQGQGARLEHVNVENISARVEHNNNAFTGPPCAIITTPTITPGDTITYSGFTYYQSIVTASYKYFIRFGS